jgi:hypothetical protein
VPAGKGLREFSTQDFGDLRLDQADKKPAAERGDFREFSTQDFGHSPLAAANTATNNDEQAGAARGKPAPAKPAPAAAQKSTPIVATSHPPQRPEPKVAPLDISIEGFKPLTVDEGGDATHVDSLPLGERVHQEAVAKELFTTGDQGSGASAVDLARWASDELSRKEKQRNEVTGAAPRLDIGGPPSGEQMGATPLVAGHASDPFAQVPDAPNFQQAEPGETTGDVVAQSGVRSNRRAIMLVAGVLAVIALVLLLIYGFVSRDTGGGAVKVEVAAPHKQLGGSGDSSVGGLMKADKAAPADAPKRDAVTASPTDGAKKGDEAKEPAAEQKEGAKLTPEQEAAMKNLGNERGVGTHSPKADGADPRVARADTGLSSEDFDRTVADNKSAFTQCIDEARRRNPRLRATKVQISVTIAPTGKVVEATIDRKEAQESSLGQCLLRSSKRIVFPAFAGDPARGVIPLVMGGGE